MSTCPFKSEGWEAVPLSPELIKIDRKDSKYRYIKYPLNSFVYSNQDHISEVEIYKVPEEKVFYMRGKEAIERISFS